MGITSMTGVGTATASAGAKSPTRPNDQDSFLIGRHPSTQPGEPR